jgi:hypothetical protein
MGEGEVVISRNHIDKLEGHPVETRPVYSDLLFDSTRFFKALLTTGPRRNRVHSAMRGLLILLTLMMMASGAAAQSPRAPIKVGDKAPEFALPNGDGKLVMLSEYTARGPVVIVFYRGFW